MLISASCLALPAGAIAARGGNFASAGHAPVRVPLLSKGAPETVSSPSGDAFYTLPVPPGTTPSEFVARLLVRGPVTGGIATVSTPTTAFPVNLSAVNGISQVAVPLSPADVSDGVISIHLHDDLTLAANPSVCAPPPAIVTQVVSAQGVFGGSLAIPRSPADFWPKTLQGVTVWLPPLAGLSSADRQAAAQASLQVAGLVAQAYGQQTSVSFAMGTLPPHAISPVRRDVAIELAGSSPSSRLLVEQAGTAPVLVVQGKGQGLVEAARAVGTNGLSLATAPTATAVRASAFAPSSSLLTSMPAGQRGVTFAQLGWPTSLQGVGTTSITQSLPQAQFGGPIRSLQLRVVGSYTPPPPGGMASFSVLVNGYIIGSERLGSSGLLAMNADVPQAVLGRVQTVVLRLDYAPPGGICHTGLLPVQVTFDPGSGFVASPGQSLPPGFARFPQVVATNLPVAIGSLSDATLIAACRLVTALSQLLLSPPNVELVPVGSVASGSQAAVVVGANPTLAERLGAPLQLAPFRAIAVPGPGAAYQIGYRVSQPFAALEAFSQNGRDVLLLGSFGDQTGALQDALTAEILGKQTGWYDLGDGQIAVATATGPPRVLQASALAPQAVGPSVAGGGGLPGWLTIALVAIGVLVAARIGWLAARMAWLRSRPRRPADAGALEELVRRLDQIEDRRSSVGSRAGADERTGNGDGLSRGPGARGDRSGI